MSIDDKDVSSALRDIYERLNGIDETLSQLRAASTALKMTLAAHIDPENSAQASEHIEKLEQNLLKLDPNRAKRKRRAEILTAQRISEKLGGPKHA